MRQICSCKLCASIIYIFSSLGIYHLLRRLTEQLKLFSVNSYKFRNSFLTVQDKNDISFRDFFIYYQLKNLTPTFKLNYKAVFTRDEI